MKLSIVITAFNEEKNVKECLESVKDLASEIIFVDNSSTDNTVKIAKSFTNKVFSQVNDPQKIDFKKNFGFSKAKGDWILSIDADERVTKDLAGAIKAKIDASDGIDGFWIPRKNIIFNKWIKSDMWSPDYQLRLFRKGSGKFIDSEVHRPLHVEGATEKLTEPLIHNNYVSISQYLQKLDIYTSIEAENLIKGGYEFNYLDALRFPIDDFLKTFFLQKGYKDGLHGLVLSILQAFYMEVVFAKIWEKNGFKEKEGDEFFKEVRKEISSTGKKVKYWLATTLIHNANNPVSRVLHKISRKISSKI